ncbi:MAG: hypothetical protein FWH07_01810 [Oscillospiraceae bacterium]|nr:hypothetical protein [Oscillospiraceae bacterium]
MSVKRTKSSFYRKFRVYIIAAALGGAASGAALVLFSLLVFLLGMPVTQSGFLSHLAFGTGCLVAGFTAGAAKRQGGLATGIKAALLFTAPIALIGMVLSGVSMPETVPAATGAAPAGVTSAGFGTFGKVVIATLCGAVGGVLGVNKNGGF